MKITYKYDCECGGEAKSTTLDLTNIDPNNIVIDVDFDVSDMELECECGKSYFVQAMIEEMDR